LASGSCVNEDVELADEDSGSNHDDLSLTNLFIWSFPMFLYA